MAMSFRVDDGSHEDSARFEKIGGGRDGRMPVHRSAPAIRGSRRTPGSKRASRRTSQRRGGTHMRRRRQMR